MCERERESVCVCEQENSRKSERKGFQIYTLHCVLYKLKIIMIYSFNIYKQESFTFSYLLLPCTYYSYILRELSTYLPSQNCL